jgi:hypothetical protein
MACPLGVYVLGRTTPDGYVCVCVDVPLPQGSQEFSNQINDMLGSAGSVKAAGTSLSRT